MNSNKDENITILVKENIRNVHQDYLLVLNTNRNECLGWKNAEDKMHLNLRVFINVQTIKLIKGEDGNSCFQMLLCDSEFQNHLHSPNKYVRVFSRKHTHQLNSFL